MEPLDEAKVNRVCVIEPSNAVICFVRDVNRINEMSNIHPSLFHPLR